MAALALHQHGAWYLRFINFRLARLRTGRAARRGAAAVFIWRHDASGGTLISSRIGRARGPCSVGLAGMERAARLLTEQISCRV